jgi:hypothetical protein
LLPVDPAGEEENDEGKRRRQRVHGASVPERLARCKTRQNRERAPFGLGPVLGPQASCDCVECADCRVIRSRPSFSHRTASDIPWEVAFSPTCYERTPARRRRRRDFQSRAASTAFQAVVLSAEITDRHNSMRAIGALAFG